MLRSLLLDHPRSAGETYFEHQRTAARFALRLLAAGVACGVHAVLPGLFKTTASSTIRALDAEMSQRSRAASPHAVAGVVSGGDGGRGWD